MIGSINNLLPFANIKFEILSKKEKKGKTSFSFYFSNVKIHSQIQWNNRVCAFLSDDLMFRHSILNSISHLLLRI